MDILKIAEKVFETEKKAIDSIHKKLDDNFVRAAKILSETEGRIIVCGIGKSGLIGKKIAATFSSIGKGSVFLHPSEAIHGDLGILKTGDTLISISNSGETDEILQLIPHIKRLKITHISLCGKSNSTLAKFADIVLDIGVEEEASKLSAVPLASSLAALAMGDALAAVLIELTDFNKEDFALNHPGGSLGRKLLTMVADIMRKDELPVVRIQNSVKDTLFVMSKAMLGLAIVCNDDLEILGIITDGDLRRALEKFGDENFFGLNCTDIMTKNPKTVNSNISVIEAEELMNNYRISALIVIENNKLNGILSKQMIR